MSDSHATIDDVLDPKLILLDVEVAQGYCISQGEQPPADTFILAGLCRRLINAEARLVRMGFTPRPPVAKRRIESTYGVMPPIEEVVFEGPAAIRRSGD